MKVFFAVLLTILLPTVPVQASPPGTSPLIGSWAVDVARLPIIYTVDADEKTMIETAAYFGPEGQPLMRTNHFSRIQ